MPSNGAGSAGRRISLENQLFQAARKARRSALNGEDEAANFAALRRLIAQVPNPRLSQRLRVLADKLERRNINANYVALKQVIRRVGDPFRPPTGGGPPIRPAPATVGATGLAEAPTVFAQRWPEAGDWEVLDEHPSLWIDNARIHDMRDKLKNGVKPWRRLSIVDRSLRHDLPAGGVIEPVGAFSPDVDIERARKVALAVRYNPIKHCGHPGKHLALSLNGGYYGSGFAREGRPLGATLNIMKPSPGPARNGLRMFVTSRGMQPAANGKTYGKVFGPEGPPLTEGKWHRLFAVIDIAGECYRLYCDDRLVCESPRLGPLLFDEGQQPIQAHIRVRLMNGGKPPDLIGDFDAHEFWQDSRILACF